MAGQDGCVCWPMGKPEGTLRLPDEYTRIPLTPEQRGSAIALAMRVTLSPHEWTWTAEEAETMARGVLWAMQRLNIIRRFTTDEPAEHATEP